MACSGRIVDKSTDRRVVNSYRNTKRIASARRAGSYLIVPVACNPLFLVVFLEM